MTSALSGRGVEYFALSVRSDQRPPISEKSGAMTVWNHDKPSNPNTLGRVFSYLDWVNATLVQKVNRCWRQAFWDQLPNVYYIPRIMPMHLWGQVVLDLFPRMIGPEVYSRFFGGDAGPVPSIPENFLRAAYQIDPVGDGKALIKDNYTLVYIPQWIFLKDGLDLYIDPVSVDPDFKNRLRGERAIRQELIGGVLRNVESPLLVPVTINNLDMLMKRRLKEKISVGILKDSWRLLLNQHGNTLVPLAHWAYLRNDVIGKGSSYPTQQDLAKNAQPQLEVATLMERLIFELFSVMLGRVCDNSYAARTATITRERIDGVDYLLPSTTQWNPPYVTRYRNGEPVEGGYNGSRMCLWYGGDPNVEGSYSGYHEVGAAVKVSEYAQGYV